MRTLMSALLILGFFALSMTAESQLSFTVRTIYFRPAGAPASPSWIDGLMHDVQQFYGDEMERNGYAAKTFRLETDRNNKVIVHTVNGKESSARYANDTTEKITRELPQRFVDDNNDIYFIFVGGLSTIDGNCGIGYPIYGWENGGYAFAGTQGGCLSISLVAHELGHAFGLYHNLEDPKAVMGIGDDKFVNYETRWLDKHHYFNAVHHINGFPKITHVHSLKSVEVEGADYVKFSIDVSNINGLHQAQILRASDVGIVGWTELNGRQDTANILAKRSRLLNERSATIQILDVRGNHLMHKIPIRLPDKTVVDVQTRVEDSTNSTMIQKPEEADPSAHLTNGLILHHRYDEGQGTTAADASGNGHDGEISNPDWDSGKFGSALRFGGEDSGSYVTVESTATLNVNECTFMAWINADHWEGTRQIVGKSVHGGCAGRTQYGLFSEDGVFKLRFETFGGRADITTDLPPTGEWVNVAFTNDGKIATIYINAEGVAEGEVSWTLKGNDDPWHIGRDCGRPTYGFAGVIDEVRLWNKALTADEIVRAQGSLTPVDSLIIRNRTDVNGDGEVNAIDLVIVASNFGATVKGEIRPNPDVNRDGIVDKADVLLVLEQLDNPYSAPALVASIESGVFFKQNRLFENYPNPFNPETWIPYQLAASADVRLHIYAANGALVRTLHVGHQPAGSYHTRSRAAYWDGRNTFGEPVASGVYFYTLTAGDFAATRKMILRK